MIVRRSAAISPTVPDAAATQTHAALEQPGRDGRFAEVAVDSPAGPGRTFSYSIPDSLSLSPGYLVWVPFGPRRLQGVVFSIEAQPSVSETRDILSSVGNAPALTPIQLELATWIADYYRCSLFEAAAPMLPPGNRVRARIVVSPGASLSGYDRTALTPLQRRATEYVTARGQVDEPRLLRYLRQSGAATISSLVSRGLLERVTRWSRPAAQPKFKEFAVLGQDEDGVLGERALELTRNAPKQAALLEHMMERGSPLAMTAARREFGSAVNALLSKGLVDKVVLPVERDPLAGRSFPPEAPVTPTRAQRAAAREIEDALAGGSPHRRTFLLHGVTGSGKTEVYLRAVQECIKLGKRAIVLVPEISLTHQTVERFASRFPGSVAILHSGLSPGEHFDQWAGIKEGGYGVVIGSRGAVFAPQDSLGLIVIDEEHEWTYKQADAGPRYHARDVALRLAELTGAVVLMGSASPDVVSYNMGLRNEFRLLGLPDRVAAAGRRGVAPLPSVQVVDMRAELRTGNSGIFSRALIHSIDRSLAEGGQAILFLNRRGSKAGLHCRRCGLGLKCRRCDVALAFHQDLGRLLCHYCGSRTTPPERCPRCFSHALSYFGAGTQAVVDEVARLFPDAGVMRWDRDSTRGRRAQEEAMDRFRSGGARILVGTQMIAKGLHFPSVTTVGAVAADVGLQVPDYRAGERVFQLLYQVAGRAGRGRDPGRAIIQTFQPDNYAIRAAAAQDYESFFTREIAFRMEHGNPPFNRLIRLQYAHTNEALTERESLRLASLLRQERDGWGYSDIQVLGPVPSYPSRVRGRYRWQVVVRGPEPRKLIDGVTIPSGWTVDVDPVSLA